jgi:phage shock protein C
MAEFVGLDANLVRVIWIGTVLFGGVGLIPYLVAIFLVPERETRSAEPSSMNGTRILGLVLIGLGGLFFLREAGLTLGPGVVVRFWSFGVLVPLGLLLAGVLLVWPRLRGGFGFSGPTRPRRSVSDRVLAGVAGGLAREMGLDSNLVRLGIVFLATATAGFFVLVYLLLLFVMPEEEIVGRAPETASGRSEGPPPPPGAPPGDAEDQAAPGEGR